MELKIRVYSDSSWSPADGERPAHAGGVRRARWRRHRPVRHQPGSTVLRAGLVSYFDAQAITQNALSKERTNRTIITGPILEDQSRKRELRLLKNREAARECRRKKKEYIKCLENRVAVLENQNKALIEELKTLKELYCQQKTE